MAPPEQLHAEEGVTAGDPSVAKGQRYIDILLEPLRPYLQNADVTDIFINEPGSIWVEQGGQVARHFACPSFTPNWLAMLAQQVAARNHQGISRAHPILSGALPDGSRIQIVSAPATRGVMAIAIRKHTQTRLVLNDYLTGGAFSTTRTIRLTDPSPPMQTPIDEAGEMSAFLADAVRNRRNILISGGTGSGKTTFLNALLRMADPHERIILIEDTPEIQLDHANMVSLLAVKGDQSEARVTTDDLLQAALRMRPDRLIVGELRGLEAASFLRAINSGHPGSISTIHANDPRGAIEQLCMILLQAGSALRRDDLQAYIDQTIDIVVQLERTTAGRKIISIATR